MKPLTALAIFLFLFLQASGLGAALADDGCEQTCPREEAGCGPACADCLCCPSMRSCEQAAVALSLPLLSVTPSEPSRSVISFAPELLAKSSSSPPAHFPCAKRRNASSVRRRMSFVTF